ncbi:MAG: cytochrome P450, partial [Phycisphaeraceae bacterium]|nr:cytochrome P450 [Phycisphaeraceae bacterium]
PTLPFPHPWNYHEPIRILETFFTGVEHESGPQRDNRYLDVPGFAPVMVTRDAAIIRAILRSTGDKPGQFDRDTLPSTGIARATGSDTLLYANGETWRRQRKLSARPFSKTSLFQPEEFSSFERTFRQTIQKRLDHLASHLAQTGGDSVEIALEEEIKVVMLEMLVNNFFGAEVEYERIRDEFAPAIDRVITRIVSDTVMNRFGVPLRRLPPVTPGLAKARRDLATFERLTDLVLAQRGTDRGLWGQFESDAPDEKLRSNLRVFLAGALEATTSFAAWAIAHLSRDVELQDRLYEEVRGVDHYSPDELDKAVLLNKVLDETLRLTPSLYFLPRRPTGPTTVETDDGRVLEMPRGTHVLLDVWHANRRESAWGEEATGFPAEAFAPDRWDQVEVRSPAARAQLHFGFGDGARVCPGKFLGQLEVGLTVGAIVQTFRFKAVNEVWSVRAGVSTKPADGALVKLSRR